MTTVTLSIDEVLLEKAKKGMQASDVTLDDVVAKALVPYAEDNQDMKEFDELMARLSYVKSSGPYTRDEMNER